MKILQINTLDIKGGASRVAYDLKNGLKKRGYSSWIFVCKKFSKDDDIFLISKDNFIKKIFRKITKRDLGLIIRNRLIKIFPTDINFFNNKGLFSSEKYKEAEIIHCHNLHSNFFNLKNLIKISKEKPVIWTLHDMWAITAQCPHAFVGREQSGFFECPAKIKNLEYLKKQKREIYEKSDFDIVVPSLWLKEKVEQSVLKNKRIHLIYNGIDNKIFKPYKKNDVRKEMNLPLNKKIIMFSGVGGKNNIYKGWDYTKKIIDSNKKDSDILFICIGGKEKSSGENIRFIKYTADKNTMAKYYSSADILLFSSIAENLPLTVLESMACGTPVVSFDVGGVKEIIEHKKDGYIAEYKNASDLNEGIKYILNLEREESEIFSKKAIEKIKNKFTLDIMTNKYKKLYKKLL